MEHDVSLESNVCNYKIWPVKYVKMNKILTPTSSKIMSGQQHLFCSCPCLSYFNLTEWLLPLSQEVEWKKKK